MIVINLETGKKVNAVFFAYGSADYQRAEEVAKEMDGEVIPAEQEIPGQIFATGYRAGYAVIKK